MKHVVGVAEAKTSAQAGDILVTHALGTCLGIAMHDPQAGVGALLHIMMPTSTVNPGKARLNPHMFVDTSIPAAIDVLEQAGASRRRLVVSVAGGIVHSGEKDDFFVIGKKNVIALRKVFWQLGMLIDAKDVGGDLPRTMYLEVGAGRVWLTERGRQWDLSPGSTGAPNTQSTVNKPLGLRAG